VIRGQVRWTRIGKNIGYLMMFDIEVTNENRASIEESLCSLKKNYDMLCSIVDYYPVIGIVDGRKFVYKSRDDIGLMIHEIEDALGVGCEYWVVLRGGEFGEVICEDGPYDCFATAMNVANVEAVVEQRDCASPTVKNDVGCVYVVSALRWGDSENHSYVFFVGQDKAMAIERAEKECTDRAGKYDCIVERFILGESCVREEVYRAKK